MKRPLPHTAKSKQTSSDGAQTRSAEVIRLRPRGGNSEARKQNKPSPQKDTLDLPLKEICRSWSKVTMDHPDLLMNGIFAAYWQCAFESGGQSPIFQWVSEKECLNSICGKVSFARTPAGNITALREKLPWPRSDLFLFLVALEKSECSGPLASRPSRTSKPAEDELRAMADRPIGTYPHDFCTIWLPVLHIARDDFARWYTGSSLSAGAPLDSFCPGPTSAVSTLKLGNKQRKILKALDAAVAAGASRAALVASAKELMQGTAKFLEGRQPDVVTYRRLLKAIEGR